MRLLLVSIGKANEAYVDEGIKTFTKRICNYYPAEWQLVPPPKNAGNLSDKELKQKEGESIMNLLKEEDYLVLLDERGKQLTSEGLAQFISQRANESKKQIVFLIGGAFGVSDAIKKRADYTWSLSSLVFPHQLVRLVLSEQIYRACTIIRNEKYHHP